jgi:hypothetical protein
MPDRRHHHHHAGWFRQVAEPVNEGLTVGNVFDYDLLGA